MSKNYFLRLFNSETCGVWFSFNLTEAICVEQDHVFSISNIDKREEPTYSLEDLLWIAK